MPRSMSRDANEQATYLTLAANIVNTVVATAAYRAEIDATNQLIDLQKQQVDIANVQAQSGTVPYANVLSLQSQLSTYQATIPQLEQKLVQSEDLLAALAGHTPAEWQAPGYSSKTSRCPATLPVSLPSDLVRQRPDIGAAEATAHAASANIGVATAALLPSVTLNGSIRGRHELDESPFSRQWPLLERRWGRNRAALRRGHALVQAQSRDR